jgi:hypothetical protein
MRCAHMSDTAAVRKAEEHILTSLFPCRAYRIKNIRLLLHGLDIYALNAVIKKNSVSCFWTVFEQERYRLRAACL